MGNICNGISYNRSYTIKRSKITVKLHSLQKAHAEEKASCGVLPFFIIIACAGCLCQFLFSVLKVEEKLAELEKVKDPQALLAAFKSLGVDLMGLAKLSGARQAVSLSDQIVSLCY